MKTTRHFPSFLTDAPARWLRGLSVVASLAAAGLAHAQGFSSLPASIALYSSQTVTNAFSLSGWNGSNVTVTVEGPGTALVTCSVVPPSGTDTSRSLVTQGDTVGGPQTLRLIAAESPTAVHTVTNTVNVTVRERPTVTYSGTNGFHNGHIDQDSTSATLTVTRNAAATVLWGRHSNATLFPAANVFPTAGSTFGLIPLAGRAGSDTFTVYVTDAFGGWTNSIAVPLTVAPVPTVNGLQGSIVFDEDAAGTNTFSVAYGGNTNLLTNTVTFAPSGLIESYAFLPVGGSSTNLALVVHPFANANGTAAATLVASDGTHTRSNGFNITVTAVPDPTSITGLPAEIFISNEDPFTNAFASVAFSDPDDDRPSPEKLDVFVSDPRLQLVFSNSTVSAFVSAVSNLNATLSGQATWIRAVKIKAADDLFGVVGSTNDIAVTVIASGRSDHLAITNTMMVHLHFKNNPPEFVVKVNPGQEQMDELETHTPFTLESITDPDDTQTSFTLSLFLAPGYEAYGTLSKSSGGALPPAGGVIGTGNRVDLDLLLRNTQFNAAEGVLTENTGNVYFIFKLYDGFDTTVQTNAITLNQLRRPPDIHLGNGAPKDVYITSAAPSAKPYPLVYVTDPDEAGSQPVRAAIGIAPEIGEIDMNTRGSMGSLQSPSALSALLRTATFTPFADALDGLAVGQSVSARITLSVTDETGLTDANNEVVVHIERVNAAPDLRVPEEQPVLFSPGAVIHPFVDVTLSSDDTNAVTFSFAIDNPAKGVFGNVNVSASGFSAQGVGGYTITSANIGHILNLVTNITFTPSVTYPFPPDDPYGTLFTLTAKDYQLFTTTRTLALQVQDPPRNWLVTKLVNDGTPGTFQHALEHFANNDVITFALPSYPATVRMSASAPVIETGRTLTVKGPGADLLTVTGDSDGNGTPDRRILTVGSPVTIEGITFAHATAPAGGAFSVSANGKLTLRNVVIRDSVATQYGGAIDVFGGGLSLEGCAFLRNAVTEDGYGGGAISTYTDCDIGITNTLFDSNAQRSPNGAGGAIFTEFPDGSLDDYAVIDIVHCTFAANSDASLEYTASSVYAASGTHVLFCNAVLADDPATRTLNLDSGAEIWSLGGNICDDSTYVPNQQQGGTSVFLLDPDFDLISTNARLAPLDTSASVIPYRLPLADSPAIGFANPSPATVLDQRGLLRVSGVNGVGAAGAADPAAATRPAVTEIQLSAEPGDTDQFIELFAPRDGQAVDLSGFTLFVNGVAVHEFGHGLLALTNMVYTTLAPAAGIPASYILTPGRGVVVTFPKGDIADFTAFSPLNPTPVVRGSLVTNAAEFAKLLSAHGRGSVAVAKSETGAPVIRQTFLTVFNDPDSVAGTSRLDTAHNSIASAPQSRGFAFIPHSSVSPAIYGGWQGRPSVTTSSILLQTPGATVDGTPFGLRNATPQAVGDAVTITEDDVGAFDVLGNDLDADGNDRLVIVDVSTASGPGAGDAAATLSQLGATVAMTPSGAPLRGTALSYDPRGASVFQALPVGVEILDTFYYEILDIGSARVDGIEGGTSSNTWITAMNHRLLTGDSVILSGVSLTAYNGEYEIAVIDEDTFAIPVPFTVAPETAGMWETPVPRTPSARSEACVTVKVTGVNDAPVVAGDVVTNVTEVSTVRIMVRPERAGALLSFPSDPVPPPALNAAHLLDNDDDIDSDDTWQTLRLVGILGSVHAILNYTGTPGLSPVTVHAPAHGLASGDVVLIANYGGHPSYNGYNAVTVVDADTFTIPCFFVDNAVVKGVWVVLNDSTRYHAVTDVGATVDLTLRADPREDHLIYTASTSTFLKGLAEGELYTNRFYQAVEDKHGAIGIGPVDIVVIGINDAPTAPPDPVGLGVLTPLVTPSNTLETVLSDGLDLLYTLPPASGTPGRSDAQVLDRSHALPGTLVLTDLWSTDEDTPIVIEPADLLANDSDIDRIDVLSVVAVEAFSREGAALALSGGRIAYDPTASGPLQALSREEMAVDTFHVAVSDGMTGGTVTSLVAVIVEGRNDTPVAQPDAVGLSEDDVFTFNPILSPEDTPSLHDFDLDIDGQWPDDRLSLIVVTNLITGGEARVDLLPLLAQYNATVSQKLNQLADWQSYTDSFEYTVTDNSFLFAVADEFYVPSNTVGRTLNVLANDRDYTQAASSLTIVEVSPTLNGGTVTIAPDSRHLAYSSPAGGVGDDFFRYVVANGKGDRRSARVLVRSVVPPLNGILSAANDHFSVAYGETAVLDVLANDNMLPSNGAGLVLSTNVVTTSMPGQPIPSGNAFVYTATNGLVPLTFTYEVSAGGVSVARADVVVSIVDRRGTLNVQNDAFSVPAGSFSNALDVLSNDTLVTGAADHLRIRALLGPAAFGTAVTNASGTALVYTPNPGFVGVEQLRYLATDSIGGTGTGVVSIAVDKVVTAIDFFAVPATTNTAIFALDVLANDRTLPTPTGTLSVVSVSPADAAIGTIQVGGDGTRLEFIPSNVVGQVDFDYVVADSTARTATGRVTIATVPAGIYANTDRFLVRGGGSNYELDVLANDRSYPDLDKSYSILSIGTGADAPQAGGSVSIVDKRLRYTPAPGFFGQESFTYVMSDSVNTDSALVTVTVSRGELCANQDNFAVFYELESGGSEARAFTLPVLRNDRVQPPLGQVLQITGLGVGTNGPSHLGEVSVGAGGVSLVYRPAVAPATSYVERFTYEISDGTDRRASAVVEVQVFNRESKLDTLTKDDAFTVARNSTNNVMPVLRNDFAQPGTAAGWTLTGVSAAAYSGTVSFSSATVSYTPAADFVGVDTFTYSVSDGLGGTGSATVRVRVGAVPTMPDLFAVLSGSASNDLDVVANDVLNDAYASEYRLAQVFGATQGGSVMLSPSNTVLYAPATSYAGPYPYTEAFFYTVSDDAAGAVTGTVQVIVHETGSDRSTTTVTLYVAGRNDIPVILNASTNAPITDKQTARPFIGVTFVEVDEQTVEPVDVLVWLDSASKGVLRELGDFVDLGGGRYGLSHVTAAYATAQIRNLLFVPTENRITVPTTEVTRFTLSVTDNKSLSPVLDSQTTVAVTAVNDPPAISGTREGQTVYAATAIRLFSSVTIHEVDDLTAQPLDVTIRLNNPTHGILRNLGSFVLLTNGVYGATGLTAAQATQQMRLIEFLYGAYSVQPNAPQLTVFKISVNDRFAGPVEDSQTSVRAYSAFEGLLQPTNTAMKLSFGMAVDCSSDFAVIGAPLADITGIASGSALVYRLVPGTTNTWAAWRQLQPSSIEANDKFGQSVSISEDLIAVGATQDEVGGAAVGTVYIFQRNLGGSNNWGQLVRIAPTNLPAASQFGFAVALDGDLLAVGAPKATLSGATPAEGSVFLFGRNQGGTNAWGEITRWEPAGQTSLDFGWSVSLSGDHLIAGAPSNKSGLPSNSPRGAAFYLSRNVGGTNKWGFAQKIVVTNLTTAVDYGYSVSVDGSVLAIGAPQMSTTDGGVGQVLLYQKAAESNGWQEVSRWGSKTANERMFGGSVSVNKDFVFISGLGQLGLVDSGDAFLYRRDALHADRWDLAEKFTHSIDNEVELSSTTVSFKRDTAIVGAMFYYVGVFTPPDVGKVFMYRFKFNNAPVVADPVPDQIAEWNEPFAYTIPAGIFADPDVGDTLTVLPSLPAGGHGLNLIGMTVTGTPTTLGPVPVRVEATDGAGGAAFDTFDVVVLVDGVLLEATPRNLWNVQHFGRSVANPALESTVWGGAANMDGYAANNDNEYAFGGVPTAGDASGVITLAAAADGNMVVSYVRRRADPALVYTVQGTATLMPPVWMNVQTLVISEQTQVLDDQYERVNVTVSVPAAGPMMFFRVIVTP